MKTIMTTSNGKKKTILGERGDFSAHDARHMRLANKREEVEETLHLFGAGNLTQMGKDTPIEYKGLHIYIKENCDGHWGRPVFTVKFYDPNYFSRCDDGKYNPMICEASYHTVFANDRGKTQNELCAEYHNMSLQEWVGLRSMFGFPMYRMY